MSWPALTYRLKQRIAELLDYESRCNLRTCSKNDRDTVDSTKFMPKMLKIYEFPSDMSEGKTIIRLDIDTFTVWFIGKENLTRIDRGWNGEIIEEFSEIKQKNRHDLIGDYLQRFSHKGFIKAETVELEGIEFPPSSTWKFKCTNAKLNNIMNNNNVAWLRNFVPFDEKFKVVEVRSWGDSEEVTELIMKMRITKTLKVDQELKFDDKDLEGIEAMDFTVSSSNVTAEGAKKRLETFLKNGNKTDKLEMCFPVPNNFDARTQFFPKELIVKKLKKENEQEGEFYGKIFGGFVNVHGVQEPREIECMQFGNIVRMCCNLYEKSKRPCMLYPFYYLP